MSGRCCAAGGARTIEFTNRGDFAPEVFKELSKFVNREAPDVILGIGSKLVRKDWVAAGNFAEITRLVRQVLGWINDAR